MSVLARRNIRRFRRSTRLTQTQLADRGGMHWRHLQKVEKGESNAPLQTITRIAGGLNIAPFKLLKASAKSKAPMKRRTR